MREWKNWMEERLLRLQPGKLLHRSLAGRADCNQRRSGGAAIPPSAQVEAELSDGSPAVRITRHYLAALSDACRAKHVGFLAVLVPGQAELGEDDVKATSDPCDLSPPEEIACRRAFDRLVRELGIESVDLLSPMLAAKPWVVSIA